mmetsp:Transcript_54200/g.118779  ORF Transcript_54200/g.118779 Transcript_54200/m.118779 type:complete len:207 (-) Transcript_54200:348-968(-)
MLSQILVQLRCLLVALRLHLPHPPLRCQASRFHFLPLLKHLMVELTFNHLEPVRIRSLQLLQLLAEPSDLCLVLTSLSLPGLAEPGHLRLHLPGEFRELVLVRIQLLLLPDSVLLQILVQLQHLLRLHTLLRHGIHRCLEACAHTVQLCVQRVLVAKHTRLAVCFHLCGLLLLLHSLDRLIRHLQPCGVGILHDLLILARHLQALL